MQPARSLSFTIAWDCDDDGALYNWNNGRNLHDTYLVINASGLLFPVVLSASTFIARNYIQRPVFFGCDAKLTTTHDTRSPIVLYLTNARYSAYTNYSYAQSEFSKEQTREIFENSFNLVTQGHGTFDAEWAECLGCATIDCSLEKIGLQRKCTVWQVLRALLLGWHRG